MIVTFDWLKHVITSLVADELAVFRAKSVPHSESSSWTDETALGETGVGFDSLGLLNLAARTNQFFHLHETGVEDYLLMEPTIGSWQKIVAKSLALNARKLTFQTSGSSGKPKPCTHDVSRLMADAEAIAGQLKPHGRVLSMVPPHHIYGFIYSVLMPDLLKAELVDIRSFSAGRLARELKAGDIIVATPHLWNFLLTSLSRFPEGVSGLVSTAPMPKALALSLRDAGLQNLIEIYGSTETNGIGWRSFENSHFKLFDWWSRGSDEASLVLTVPSEKPEQIELMDRLSFINDQEFVPVGRRDEAIQIGGMNVFPNHIAKILCQVEGVLDCAVRPFSMLNDSENQRLKAFIVANQKSDVQKLENEIRLFAISALKTAERPVRYTFGDSLPLTETGKQSDWVIDQSK